MWCTIEGAQASVVYMTAVKDESKNIRILGPQEVIFREGDPANAMYIVKTGQIEIYRATAAGKRIPLGVITQGAYLGEVAVLTDTPAHSSTAITLTVCEVIEISKTAMQAQFASGPGWLVSLARDLAVKLKAANQIIRKNKLVDADLADGISKIEDSNDDKS